MLIFGHARVNKSGLVTEKRACQTSKIWQRPQRFGKDHKVHEAADE